MRRIPGNEHFRDRVEYTTIVDFYFGRKAYIAAQIGLNGALQSLNIISVIQSAQVMDNAIAAIFGRSCGFNISPFAIAQDGHTISASTHFWSCINTNQDFGNNVTTMVDHHPVSYVLQNAWGCHIVITMGFLVAAAITLPMG